MKRSKYISPASMDSFAQQYVQKELIDHSDFELGEIHSFIQKKRDIGIRCFSCVFSGIPRHAHTCPKLQRETSWYLMALLVWKLSRSLSRNDHQLSWSLLTMFFSKYFWEINLHILSSKSGYPPSPFYTCYTCFVFKYHLNLQFIWKLCQIQIYHIW